MLPLYLCNSSTPLHSPLSIPPAKMAAMFTLPSSLFILVLLLTSSSPLSVFSASCNSADQVALLAIKTAFSNANHFASWTTTTACCHWYGVDCDPTTGRVNGLRVFSDTDLAGIIPSAVGDLPYLTTLMFHKLPKLTGNIPSTITSLTRLTLLDLSCNSLSGTIPPFLSLVTSLTDLDLSSNQFSGVIPPSLSALPNLLALHLECNALTGAIPSSFGSFPSSSPPDLYLSHNTLSGLVPATLSQPKWGIIDLSYNKLTGDVSFLFGASKPATQMDLSRNQFAFDLTNVSFPLGLTSLDLSNNAIYGAIPAQVNQVTGLVLFNVSYNQLCGAVPSGAVTAKFDHYSYDHNKCLGGPPLASEVVGILCVV